MSVVLFTKSLHNLQDSKYYLAKMGAEISNMRPKYPRVDPNVSTKKVVGDSDTCVMLYCSPTFQWATWCLLLTQESDHSIAMLVKGRFCRI